MYIPWCGRALHGEARARRQAGGFSIKYCANISRPRAQNFTGPFALPARPFLASFCYSSQGRHLNDYSFDEEVLVQQCQPFLRVIWYKIDLRIGLPCLIKNSFTSWPLARRGDTPLAAATSIPEQCR